MQLKVKQKLLKFKHAKNPKNQFSQKNSILEPQIDESGIKNIIFGVWKINKITIFRTRTQMHSLNFEENGHHDQKLWPQQCLHHFPPMKKNSTLMSSTN